MNIVYRFRIYPNKSQKELFARTFGCVRFVYNRMLAEKIEYYEKTGKVLKVTPAKYKAEFPWLKEVDSLALCNAQLHLQTAYKNFFRGFFGWFSEVQVKKESGEKLYDKLRKWKYYFAECETETSESRLDPHKTASEYR